MALLLKSAGFFLCWEKKVAVCTKVLDSRPEPFRTVDTGYEATTLCIVFEDFGGVHDGGLGQMVAYIIT